MERMVNKNFMDSKHINNSLLAYLKYITNIYIHTYICIYIYIYITVQIYNSLLKYKDCGLSKCSSTELVAMLL